MPTTPIPGGFFIVIEGIDGAGKSSHARRLALLLGALGFEVVASREPTLGESGRRLRESMQHGRLAPAEEHRLLLLDRRGHLETLLRAALLRGAEDEHRLLLLDRREHLETLVRPALARGAVVILDRYYHSSVAYQGAAGLDPARVRADNEAFADRPHLLLLLDLDVDSALRRIAARGDRPTAFESRRTLAACRETYLGFAALPEARLLDARAPIDQVGAAVDAATLRALYQHAPAAMRSALGG
jgi:dTMP kinase